MAPLRRPQRPRVHPAWLTGGALLVGLGVYARWIEPRWLQLRHSRIHVPRLPGALEGFRIALLTDMHAGTAADFQLIRKAVRRVMAERPHIVALTGDFAADDAQDFCDVLSALDGLSAPYGVFAVPGNHDYIVGIGKWRRDIAEHPEIQDLTNRCRTLDVDGARLCVAGVDDFFKGNPGVLLPPPDERHFTLLLAHSPDQAERCRRGDDAVDLIVSGHTHAGQVRLPFVGAPVSSAELGREGVLVRWLVQDQLAHLAGSARGGADGNPRPVPRPRRATAWTVKRGRRGQTRRPNEQFLTSNRSGG